MKSSVLVIEDDEHTAAWVRTYLERAGFSVDTAGTGALGLEMIHRTEPDLILLDLMLPDGDGRDLCHRIRRDSPVPLIMLTARTARTDRLSGLAEGADDYITKPFDPDELVLRIKAVLRRSEGHVSQKLTCGPMILERDKGSFTLYGEEIRLSRVQRELMAVLMSNLNCILSREQLIDQALRSDFEGCDRAVDTHIQRLRRLLHREGFAPIQTVYGEGYRLFWEGG